MRRIQCAFRGYTHEVMDETKIVTDSSLSRGGFEIVSPPLMGRGVVMSWISRMMSHLRGVAEVDRSCGLHVHVGLRDYGARANRLELGFIEPSDDLGPEDYAKAVTGRVAWAYGYFQKAINLMVSPSRRNGEWSRDVSYLSQQYRNPSEVRFPQRKWDEDNGMYVREWHTETDPARVGMVFYDRLYEGHPDYGDSRYHRKSSIITEIRYD